MEGLLCVRFRFRIVDISANKIVFFFRKFVFRRRERLFDIEVGNE